MGILKTSKHGTRSQGISSLTNQSSHSIPLQQQHYLDQAFQAWSKNFKLSVNYIRNHISFNLAETQNAINWQSDETFNTRLETIVFDGTDNFYRSLDKHDYANLVGMLVAYKELLHESAISASGNSNQNYVIQNPKEVARWLFKCDEMVIKQTHDPQGYYDTLSKLAYFHMVPQVLDKRLLSLDKSYSLDLERLLLIVNQYHLGDRDNLMGYVKQEPFESVIYGEVLPDKNKPDRKTSELPEKALKGAVQKRKAPLKYHGRNFIFSIIPELDTRTKRTSNQSRKFSVPVFLRDFIISVICLNFFIGFIAKLVTSYDFGFYQWILAALAGSALSFWFQKQNLKSP